MYNFLTAVVSMVTVFLSLAGSCANFVGLRASTMFALPMGSPGKMPHPTDTRQAISVLIGSLSLFGLHTHTHTHTHTEWRQWLPVPCHVTVETQRAPSISDKCLSRTF